MQLLEVAVLILVFQILVCASAVLRFGLVVAVLSSSAEGSPLGLGCIG